MARGWLGWPLTIVGIGETEMTDRDLRRMCAVQNSDDSGVGMTVPDVAYPVKAEPGIDPNTPIDSIEVRMRKVYSIFENESNKTSDRLNAMQFFLELERYADSLKAGKGNENDRLA
jgi:hypothetical protein